jgi:hypothetical protein
MQLIHLTEDDIVDPPTCADLRGRHWLMLIVACAVVVLSFALQVVPGGRVALAIAPEHPLPESCMSWRVLGLRCPGCGLTRSFVFLAHGDVASSLAVHRVGWVLALAVLLQFPYRLAGLIWPERELLTARFRAIFSAALIVLLIGNWVFGLVEPYLP